MSCTLIASMLLDYVTTRETLSDAFRLERSIFELAHSGVHCAAWHSQKARMRLGGGVPPLPLV